MRTIVLLPLTAVVAVVAGCGSGAKEQAAGSLPQRDLTLVTPTAQVEIASPVETQQLRIQRRTARHSQLAARLAAVAAPVAALGAAAPVLAAAEPVVEPAATEVTPANDRELLPGKTVTVIPASSGSPAGSDEVDEPPRDQGRPMVVRGGGTCRGRGRGPGIIGAPRPDFR
jgi:hypothetical protein